MGRECVLRAHNNIHGVPAAKLHYHTILANVDWLHGLAESNLTITNLLIGMLPHLPYSCVEETCAPEESPCLECVSCDLAVGMVLLIVTVFVL